MSKKSRTRPARSTPARTPAQTPAPQWKPGSTRPVLAVILAASTALGLVCVLQYRNCPYFDFPIIDEKNFVDWAVKISAGNWLGGEVFYLDPLYPYFLAVLFKVFGRSLMLVRIMQVALGTASVALVFFTARRLAGDAAGLIAAAILAAYHGLYFYELLVLKGIFVVFLSAAACALGVRAADRGESRTDWGLLGLCLGALMLLRGNFQALLPAALVWALVQDRAAVWRQRLTRAGLVLAGAVIVVAPVTVRNHAVGGEWVLTTSQAGANFYLGNNELAHGFYTTLPFVRPDPEHERGDFQAEAERRAGRPLTPAEVSRFWFGEGFKWINNHPGDWLWLTLHKCHLLVHQFEMPDNYSFEVTRRYFAPALWAAALGFGVIWGPAAAGMAVMFFRDRRSWWPTIFCLGYAASIVPFFIVDRYRLAIVPGAAVFAGCFMVWTAEQWTKRDRGKLAGAGAGLAVALAIGFWPIAEWRATDPVSLYNLGNTYVELGQPDQALPWLDRARAVVPADHDVAAARAEAMLMINGPRIQAILRQARPSDLAPAKLIEFGKELEGLGQTPLAAELYERALQISPELVWARGRLALLYRTDPLLLDPARALAQLQTGLKYNPDHPELLNAIAEYYFAQGDLNQARRYWERTLQIAPDHTAAQRGLDLLRPE